MTGKSLSVLLIGLGLLIPAGHAGRPEGNWICNPGKGYVLCSSNADSINVGSYRNFIDTGMDIIEEFFNLPYRSDFLVYIHGDRLSLDTTWQQNWEMPGFCSECWMVASGTAERLDLLSPRVWEVQACEHDVYDQVKTQRLVTHELVHVFHCQRNPSKDFSGVNGLDWLVEGMAVYVSGQCDPERISRVRDAIRDGNIPGSLDLFWTGPHRYGLSGTICMYIDRIAGRNTLTSLLHHVDISEVLIELNTTGPELLQGWREFILTGNVE